MRKLKKGHAIVALIGVSMNVLMIGMWVIIFESLVVGTIFLILWVGYGYMLLSKNGDRYLDLTVGTRRPTRDEHATLTSTIDELRSLANSNHQPFLSEIRIRVMSDLYPNAIAFGHKSIAVTKGLLEGADRSEIRAVFAHEVAHHINGDARDDLFVSVAFGPLTVLGIIIYKMMLGLFAEAGLGGIAVGLFAFFAFLPATFSVLILIVWSLIQGFKSQSKEYAADGYAVSVTGDDGLVRFLEQIEHLDARPTGFLAMQARSHPPTALRIDKANELMQS